jgi:hypothetical protein
MTSAEIVSRARADGVHLELLSGDSIRATGKHKALNQWVPIIRKHKPAILRYLWTENLSEHYQEIRQILEREIRLPASVADEQARAAAALLAVKLNACWAALREALGDQSLPNTDEPVDRLPYPLPHWLRLPNKMQGQQSLFDEPQN